MFSEPSETGSEGGIKCPREQLSLLCVGTTLCEKVIAFVLDQVIERTTTLLDIVIDRDAHSQWIGVLLEPGCNLARAKLVIAIEKYPAVLSVELIDYAGRCQLASDGAAPYSVLSLSALAESSKRKRRRTILGHPLV